MNGFHLEGPVERDMVDGCDDCDAASEHGARHIPPVSDVGAFWPVLDEPDRLLELRSDTDEEAALDDEQQQQNEGDAAEQQSDSEEFQSDEQMNDGGESEMRALNSQIEFINRALDDIEQKNSDLQQKLVDFLSSATPQRSNWQP